MNNTSKQKQLILVRHAHALEGVDFFGSDHDVPLSPKGREYTTIVTRYLRLVGITPNAVVSSSALRTRETAGIMAQEYGITDIRYADDLYVGKNPKTRHANHIYLGAIQQTSPDVDTLVIVGHNDEITEFARYISDDGMPSMKKWSLVILSIPPEMSWNNIVPWHLSILYYLTPQFLQLEDLK
jgi:phosphohistidine phosphatase